MFTGARKHPAGLQHKIIKNTYHEKKNLFNFFPVYMRAITFGRS